MVAQPAALISNLVVRFVGHLMTRNHADSPQTVKTIAVCKIVGMGSVLRSSPMLRSIRMRYPHARILYITSVSNVDIVRRLNIVDSTIALNDKSFLFLFIDTLRQLMRCWYERIDLFFDLEVYSAFTTLFATASLARNRYGFYSSRTGFRFGLNTHLVYFNDSRSITEVYLHLAAAAGCSVNHTGLVAPQIYSNEYAEAEERLVKFPDHEETGYLVVNVNASELLLERRWPAPYFSALIEAVISTIGMPVFLVGSPDEKEYTSGIIDTLPVDKKNLTTNTAGRISLGGAMALIARARLMITNDTGLYHVTASLAVPMISLWGPGSPMHYGTHTSNDEVIFYSDSIYCSPCLYKIDEPACRGNNVCMKAISPVDVYLAVCDLLGHPHLPEWRTKLSKLYEETFTSVVDITLRRP